MAINPMQRKARNSFLLGMILTLLVTGVVIVLLFLQMKKLNDAKAAEEAAKVNVYTINQDVKSGQIITNDMLVKLNVNKNTIPSNATAMDSVVSTWTLQTKDGKEIKVDENGLYIQEADNLDEVTYANGQYTKLSDGKTVSLRNDPYTDTINEIDKRYIIETQEDATTGTTRIYEDEKTGNCYKYKINAGKLEREYIDLNNVAILAKVDMKKNTVVTKDLVVQADAVVTDDVRVEEYNMVSLPVDLATDDYIDIRIMYPNGENFVIVPKRQVDIPKNEDGTYVADTIRVQLNEEEILAMSSAIVEAYGLNGTKIYANKYVEPGSQKSSLPTYTPNSAVTALIESDPNILDRASEGLRARYSDSAKQIRNNYIQNEINNADQEEYNDNITTKMNTGITNADEARKLYLETLQSGGGTKTK